MEHVQQRKREVLASNLLFASFILTLTFWLLKTYVLHKAPAPYRITNPWVVIPLDATTLGWFYAIRLGKRWAKILLLVILVITIPYIVLVKRQEMLSRMQEDFLYGLEFIGAYGFYLGALILLFWKPKSQVAV